MINDALSVRINTTSMSLSRFGNFRWRSSGGCRNHGKDVLGIDHWALYFVSGV